MMSHSLTTADRRTHGKIIAVALISVAALVTVAASANTAVRTEAPRQVAQGVVKAAKPLATATRYYTVIR